MPHKQGMSRCWTCRKTFKAKGMLRMHHSECPKRVVSDLHRLVWQVRGSSVGGSGLWGSHQSRNKLSEEAARLTKMFPDLVFMVEKYVEESDDE